MPSLSESKNKLQETKKQLRNIIEKLDGNLKTENQSFFDAVKELLDIPLHNFNDDSKILEIEYLNNKLSTITAFIEATEKSSQAKLELMKQLQEVGSEETRKKLFDLVTKNFTDYATNALSANNDFFNPLTENKFDIWFTKNKTEIVDSVTEEIQQAVTFIKELDKAIEKLTLLKTTLKDQRLINIEARLVDALDTGNLDFDGLLSVIKELQYIELEPTILKLTEQRDELQALIKKLPEEGTTTLKTTIEHLIDELEGKLYLKQITTINDERLIDKSIDNLKNILHLYESLFKLQKGLENLPQEEDLYESINQRLNNIEKSLNNLDIKDPNIETKLNQITEELQNITIIEKSGEKATTLAKQLNNLQFAIQSLPKVTTVLTSSAEDLLKKLNAKLLGLKNGTSTIDQRDIDTATETIDKLKKVIDLYTNKYLDEHLNDLRKGLENLQPKEGKLRKISNQRLTKVEKILNEIGLNPLESIAEFKNILDQIIEELNSVETLEKLGPTITESIKQQDELQTLIEELPEFTTQLKKTTETLLKEQQEKLQGLENVTTAINQDDVDLAAKILKAVQTVIENKEIINKLPLLKNNLKSLPLEEGIQEFARKRLTEVEAQLKELNFDIPKNTFSNITKELQHIEALEESGERITFLTKDLSELQTLINGLPKLTETLKNSANNLFIEWKNKLQNLKTTENTLNIYTTVPETANKLQNIIELNIEKILPELQKDLTKLPTEEGLRAFASKKLITVEILLRNLNLNDTDFENKLIKTKELLDFVRTLEKLELKTYIKKLSNLKEVIAKLPEDQPLKKSAVTLLNEKEKILQELKNSTNTSHVTELADKFDIAKIEEATERAQKTLDTGETLDELRKKLELLPQKNLRESAINQLSEIEKSLNNLDVSSENFDATFDEINKKLHQLVEFGEIAPELAIQLNELQQAIDKLPNDDNIKKLKQSADILLKEKIEWIKQLTIKEAPINPKDIDTVEATDRLQMIFNVIKNLTKLQTNEESADAITEVRDLLSELKINDIDFRNKLNDIQDLLNGVEAEESNVKSLADESQELEPNKEDALEYPEVINQDNSDTIQLTIEQPLATSQKSELRLMAQKKQSEELIQTAKQTITPEIKKALKYFKLQPEQLTKENLGKLFREQVIVLHPDKSKTSETTPDFRDLVKYRDILLQHLEGQTKPVQIQTPKLSIEGQPQVLRVEPIEQITLLKKPHIVSRQSPEAEELALQIEQLRKILTSKQKSVEILLLNGWVKKLNDFSEGKIPAISSKTVEETKNALKLLETIDDEEKRLKTAEKELIPISENIMEALKLIDKTETKLSTKAPIIEEINALSKILDKKPIPPVIEQLQKTLKERMDVLKAFKEKLDSLTDDQLISNAIGIGVFTSQDKTVLESWNKNIFNLPAPGIDKNLLDGLKASLRKRIDEDLTSMKQQVIRGEKVLDTEGKVKIDLKELEKENQKIMYQTLEKRLEKLQKRLSDLQKQLTTYKKGWGYSFSNVFNLGNLGKSIAKTQQDIIETLTTTNSLEKKIKKYKDKNIDKLKRLENKITAIEFQIDEGLQDDVEKITGRTTRRSSP